MHTLPEKSELIFAQEGFVFRLSPKLFSTEVGIRLNFKSNIHE